MKRLVTTKAYIEFVESFDYWQLTLNCLTPKLKRLETSVSYNKDAPRHAASFQRYRLFQHLCKIQGIDEQDAYETQYRCLALRYYTFRLLELKPGIWIIDAAVKSDPFPIERDYSEADRLIEEMFGVR